MRNFYGTRASARKCQLSAVPPTVIVPFDGSSGGGKHMEQILTIARAM